MKQKKWRIELTESQLWLIANCVEDCHRYNAFIKPQLKLMQFLLSAREQNKRVIIFKRKNKL